MKTGNLHPHPSKRDEIRAKRLHLLVFILMTFAIVLSARAQQCSCIQCNGTVVVDENVTVNFNTGTPTYTGDADLAPYFSWEKAGATADTWKAIFNLGSNKLIVRNGATITVTNVPNSSNNQKAPGILIRSTCDVEVENGGHIVVNSVNQKAGDIVIEVNGNIIINGEIRNEVSGTNGLPGAISCSSSCGNISVGSTGLVQVLGVDPGGNSISFSTCGLSCNPGDITINGLVRSYAHAHAGDLTLNRPTIKVVSFNGSVTINANSVEPLYDEFSLSGGKYDLFGGLLAWVRDNVNPGKVEVQAKGDIKVNGHGDDATGPVRTSFGAIASVATASNAPGGLVDVRSMNGSIIGNDRAFDVSGRNRLSTNFAKIKLWARYNIDLNKTGANNSFNPVVDASSPSVGDKGGTNEIRAFSGSITIGPGAQVAANVPNGNGSVQGNNYLTACGGVNNSGTVIPADADNSNDAGTCAPLVPYELFVNTCIPDDGGEPSKRNAKARDGSELMTGKMNSLQTYPNPFNQVTSINYTLASAENVTIRLYNIAGKEIKTLVNGVQAEGDHRIQWNAADLPGGVYIIQLRAGNFVAVNRLILIK